MKVAVVPLIAVAAFAHSAWSFSPQSSARSTSVSSKPSADGSAHHNHVSSKKRSRATQHSSMVAGENEQQHHQSAFNAGLMPTHDNGYHILHPEKRLQHQHHVAAGTTAGYHMSHALSKTSLGMTYDLTVDEYINFAGDDSLLSTDATSTYSFDKSKLMDIVSAALLITGNTVGAGTMLLPEIAAGPGLGMSTALLAGIYSVNLISGLLLAEVAIKQHESSGGDVPSSFKEFAESSLQCSTTANCISSISIFVNWCVLSFAITRAGELASTLVPNAVGHGLLDNLDPTLSAAGVAAFLTGLVGSQTNHSLSRYASAAVTVLFASFAGLLLPGLANVHDPVGAFFAPGTTCSGDIGCALTTAAPIFLSTMIYQNIVPTVTKLLDYDRQQTTVAITGGSMIPLLIYSAYNLSVLGGGLDASVGASGGPILTAFVTASLAGSSIAGVMTLSEEFDNVLFNKNKDEPQAQELSQQEDDDSSLSTASTASLPSVLLAIAPPLIAGSALASGGGATAALDIAGGYCSPLLYGILPVIMAAKQREGDKAKAQGGYSDSTKTENLVPGGICSLGLLGTASAGFILQNFVSDVGDVMSSVGLA